MASNVFFFLAFCVILAASENVTVLSPTAHTTWAEYDYRSIRWSCPSDMRQVGGSLELWRDQALIEHITEIVCGKEFYSWIPSSHPTADNYRIKFAFGSSVTFSGQFRLSRPWAHFTQPDHTTQWPVASRQLVTWEYDDDTDDIGPTLTYRLPEVQFCEASSCEKYREQTCLFGLGVTNFTWRVPQLDVHTKYRFVLVNGRHESFSQAFRLQTSDIISVLLVTPDPTVYKIYDKVTPGQVVRVLASSNPQPVGPTRLVLQGTGTKAPHRYTLTDLPEGSSHYDFKFPALPPGEYRIRASTEFGLTGTSEPFTVLAGPAPGPTPTSAVPAILGFLGGALLAGVAVTVVLGVWWRRRGRHLKHVEEMVLNKFEERKEEMTFA